MQAAESRVKISTLYFSHFCSVTYFFNYYGQYDSPFESKSLHGKQQLSPKNYDKNKSAKKKATPKALKFTASCIKQYFVFYKGKPT